MMEYSSSGLYFGSEGLGFLGRGFYGAVAYPAVAVAPVQLYFWAQGYT
jgi:hypothetical protein